MFISLDLETTGFDARNDKIIEFGATKFDLNGEIDRLQFVVNPGIKLPDIITHITNIKDEDLEGQPSFSEKLEEVQNFIGDLPIIGHNIQFDTGFLKANGVKLDNPEYDTCQLAGILLPGLTSYSLEILSHVLELEHEEKHRALDDAIAAMELFLKLEKEFATLPKEMFEKIQNLCEKTTWPLTNFIKTIEWKEEKKSEEPLIDKPKLEPTDFPEQETSALFEIKPPYEDLIAKLAKNDTYIAIPNQFFKKITDKLPDSISTADSPSKYLSEEKLEKFTKKSFFEPQEFTALLKLLVWKGKTKTGHLSEITLFNEERAVIPFINAEERTNPTPPTVCSHQYLIETKPKTAHLVIFDPDKFTQALSTNKAKYIKVETLITILNQLPKNDTVQNLISKSEIIFGLIGILFTKFNDRNEFIKRAMIKELILQSEEAKNLNASIKGLLELSKDLKDLNNEENAPVLTKWKEALSTLIDSFKEEDKEIMTWLEEDFDENVVLRRFPNSTNDELHEILENAEKYSIIGENIDLDDDAKFTKKLLDLPHDLPLIKTTKPREDLEIFITQDADDDKNAVLNFLKDYLPQKKGRTAVIFNSKQQLRYHTLELSKSRPDLKVVSQTTGSLGKLREQYKQDPDNSILFITPMFWENFQDHDLIDSLLVHKIPFDPPSIPYIVATSKRFANAFIQFAIPRATFNLKKIVNSLPKSANQKEIILLDSRLATKDYGKPITKIIENLATTKIVNLSTLE